MPILTVPEFQAVVHPGVRVLALDVGAKTVGLASALSGADLVMPLKTLRRVKFTRDAEALLLVIQQYEVGALVVGYPLQLDGSEGPRCQSVRDFTAELLRFLGGKGMDLPVTFWDERFTTIQADEVIHRDVDKLGTKRDQMIDALAAQQILMDFIEHGSLTD